MLKQQQRHCRRDALVGGFFSRSAGGLGCSGARRAHANDAWESVDVIGVVVVVVAGERVLGVPPRASAP